jgi:hypothetical protein
VTARLEQRDEGPEEDDVGGVRDVDPDAHRDILAYGGGGFLR